MIWSQTYPGIQSMVPAIRAFVRAMLDGSPRQEDAELIATELGTNSLRHTPSGAGGQVRLDISVLHGYARIAVTDEGAGGWENNTLSETDEEEESGRGLQIVVALADKVGHEVTDSGQTVWAELHWPVPDTEGNDHPMATDEDALSAIAADFPGWHLWRPRRMDSRPSSWAATRREETAGVDPTVMANTAEDLRAALAEQRDMVERTGRQPLLLQVFPEGDEHGA